MSKKKYKIIWREFIFRLFLIIALAVILVFGYFAYKIKLLEKKISSDDLTSNNQSVQKEETGSLFQTTKNFLSHEKKQLKGYEKKRVNILLLGMGGEGHSGKYLTDTIILASINPDTYQSALLSIPRDLYVKIPRSDISTKINAVYAYEIKQNPQNAGGSLETLKNTIKEITGQTVDYHIALDFEGFKQIIDEVDGIDLEVTKDILDTRYPGPNFSYETFEIKKGFQHLDGENALKYSRVRHTEGGDFGRAARQQDVMAATKKKAFSLKTVANPVKISSLIDILGQHLKTDIKLDEIPTFLELAKNINIYQTTNKVLDAWSADSLLASTHVQLGQAMAYVLIPRAKNYSEIQELAENIFDLDAIERKKASIAKEDASVLVDVKNTANTYKIRNNFSKLGYKNIIVENNKTAIKCDEKNLLLSNSPEPKYFTLDDLSKKLDAQITEKRLENIDWDIIICLSGNSSNYFEMQYENINDEIKQLMEGSILDEKGRIRVNLSN